MGILHPIFSSGVYSTETATILVLDYAGARVSPGVDDVLGEPFLPKAHSGDEVGQLVRTGVEHDLRAKVTFAKDEEQQQDQVGDDPLSMVTVTLYADDLAERGLLGADGQPAVRRNDRLLRVTNRGVLRADFTRGVSRHGLRCLEVRHGDTGTRTFVAVFEQQKASAR